jgi:ketosteroid isomerase-like protein
VEHPGPFFGLNHQHIERFALKLSISNTARPSRFHTERGWQRNGAFRLLLCISLLLSACSTVTVRSRSDLLSELAEIERSFAAMSVEEGMRKAFIHYFADDGYNFDGREDPIKPRQDFPKQPAPEGQPRYQLDWFPVYTDMAAAGDMGLNTGPFVVVDLSGENPSSHGYFFSIWERQADGTWRVTVDIGTSSAVPNAEQKALSWTTPAPSGYTASLPVEHSREIDDLRKHEFAFVAAISDNGIAKGYGMYLHSEARLHRDGIFPVMGEGKIARYLSAIEGRLSWQPTLVKVSSSGDLGYSWGKYRANHTSMTSPRGHYCHVWKRNSDGEWKLVADIQYPIAPP